MLQNIKETCEMYALGQLTKEDYNAFLLQYLAPNADILTYWADEYTNSYVREYDAWLNAMNQVDNAILWEYYDMLKEDTKAAWELFTVLYNA